MYTMMEACRETDMTYQALKFYCNEGARPQCQAGQEQPAASLTSGT